MRATPRAARSRRTSLRAAGLAALVGGALTGVAAPARAAPAAGLDVCAGVLRCRVVGSFDVDGNGTPDQVGLARRGRDRTPDAWVMVRVRVSPTRVVVARRWLSYWSGPAWQGSAYVDGVRGAELVLGRSGGLHTSFFQVLTWRDGRLVGLRAPDGDDDWIVDDSPDVSSGWLRRAGEHAGTLTQRSAQRLEPSGLFLGGSTRYVWTDGRWEMRSQVTSTGIAPATAAGWGGFAVRGLERF